MSGQQYAVPVPYFLVNDADLNRLRSRLSEAEQRAARATDFTNRTRAEQDVKILTRELNGAELARKVEARQARVNRPPVDQHAVAVQRAVEQGRCLAPVPYYVTQTKTQERVPPQETAAELVAWLKAEARGLEALIATPATTSSARTGAQARLQAVKVLLEAYGAAHGPRLDTGMSAANSRREESPISFAQLTRMVETARAAGVFRTT